MKTKDQSNSSTSLYLHESYGFSSCHKTLLIENVVCFLYDCWLFAVLSST